MPLIKKASKAAFKHNLEAEMDAGKPKDQSIAIAYNAQRMAKKKGYASGGMVSSDESDEHYDSIADAILRQKKSSDSGEVDISENGEESGQAPYDNMNHDAVMKELYDAADEEDQPEDSNMKGDMFGSIKRKRR